MAHRQPLYATRCGRIAAISYADKPFLISAGQLRVMYGV